MKRNLLLLVILLECKLFSIGQCDSTLRPSENPSVAYRLRGSKCEGEYLAQVGAPSIEIASFTIGLLTYKLERNEIIKIINPAAFPIHIRSSALSIDTYYRMDALLKRRDTLKWSVNDVLLDLGISSRYLGVYGWFGSGQEKTYLPARPVTSITNQSDRNIYLIIRPSTRCKEAQYRYGLAGQPPGDYQTAGLSNARESITITLPASLRGLYNIEIAVQLESGNSWIVEQYKFRIP